MFLIPSAALLLQSLATGCDEPKLPAKTAQLTESTEPVAPPSCAAGLVPVDIKLYVTMRHTQTPLPKLPEGGFTLTVDGLVLETGVSVGTPTRLCVLQGKHALVVTAKGGQRREVEVDAPGESQIRVEPLPRPE